MYNKSLKTGYYLVTYVLKPKVKTSYENYIFTVIVCTYKQENTK